MLGAMTGCGKKEESVSTDLIIKEYAKGLDLKLVGDLARKSKNAADFEKQLNTTSNKINNLDLNDDGKVDYIKVTEYGKGNKRGFSLTTDVGKGKEQEIATIEFVKSGEKVDMYVNGNSSLYGNNHHYRSHFGAIVALDVFFVEKLQVRKRLTRHCEKVRHLLSSRDLTLPTLIKMPCVPA